MRYRIANYPISIGVSVKFIEIIEPELPEPDWSNLLDKLNKKHDSVKQCVAIRQNSMVTYAHGYVLNILPNVIDFSKLKWVEDSL